MTDPADVFLKVEISNEQKSHLMAVIRKKMELIPQKIRTTFNLNCYTWEGMDAIRDSMLAAEKECSDETFKITFSVV